MTAISEILALSPVIPVVTIADAQLAAPLAKALLAGGIGVIEVTLRTPAALEAIARIGGEVEGMVVGAGTILTPADAEKATETGAAFLVSPGLSPKLARAAFQIPLLPGVATTSEVMAARELGFKFLKLFPAEAAGGRALLKSIGGPIPDVKFCPTGGITPETAPDYLMLPNVACIGGSWIASDAAIAAQDWAGITARAQAAAALRAGKSAVTA